jgi:hypothetical protein
MSINYIHVVKHSDGWVIKEDNKKIVGHAFPTKALAREHAIDIARKIQGQLVVHSSNGNVQSREIFRSTPFPPKRPREVISVTLKDKNRDEKIKRAVKNVVIEKQAHK